MSDAHTNAETGRWPSLIGIQRAIGCNYTRADEIKKLYAPYIEKAEAELIQWQEATGYDSIEVCVACFEVDRRKHIEREAEIVGLREELSKASYIISKGDANYRRLLGDRHWPFETPFKDIVSYMPSPVVALRALKSEVACGLAPGQAEKTADQDPDWLINGKWGVVQFGD